MATSILAVSAIERNVVALFLKLTPTFVISLYASLVFSDSSRRSSYENVTAPTAVDIAKFPNFNNFGDIFFNELSNNPETPSTKLLEAVLSLFNDWPISSIFFFNSSKDLM